MRQPEQQRAIVQVRWGPSGGRKAIVEPGQPLRIGRTDLADLVISGDAMLSRVHCQLWWDQSQLRLRDLNSQQGTLLGGEPVQEAEVAHGGWIRAGETDLSVYFEGHTPRRATKPEDPVVASCRPQALATLRTEAQQRRLYAVLDAARDDRILELLRESVEEYRCLYEGLQAETLAHVAPYLVELGADSRLLDALVNEGWGHRWGIYLSSRRRPRAIRGQLRRFLTVVDDETGKKLLFRFYDPKVLHGFLRTATVRQRDHLMTDVTAFIAEEHKTGRPLRFGPSQVA